LRFLHDHWFVDSSRRSKVGKSFLVDAFTAGAVESLAHFDEHVSAVAAPEVVRNYEGVEAASRVTE
jgi:hypothetical protein